LAYLLQVIYKITTQNWNQIKKHKTIPVPNDTFTLLKVACHLKIQSLPKHKQPPPRAQPSICSPQKLPYFPSIISILTCALVFYDQNMR